MKNLKIFLTLLLSIAGGFSLLSAQTPAGTITIDGKEVELFYKVKTSTPVIIPTPDPVIVPTPVPYNFLVDQFRYDLIKGFVMHFKINGKTPEQISWDGTTYWPFSIATQEQNKTGTYWLKSGGTINKIEVKTGDFNSIPYIIGSYNAVPQPVPTPVIIDNSNNQSDGDFNPNGNSVEMLPVGETYQVPIDRNIIQMSSFSFGKNGIQGMEAYLKQYGKLICYLRNADGEVTNGGYSNNNHPMMTQIVIKTGDLEVGYKNSTNVDYPIVHGLARISNNMGYTFYYPKGLNAAFYYKQLGKNETSVKRFNVEIGDDYGWIQEKQPGSLVKDFNVNFWLNGKLYLEEMMWNGDNEFKYNVPVKANSSETRCIRSKKEAGLEVCLKIDTKGYGETGSVTLVSSKGGLQVSKDMVRISGYVYNFVNFSAQEGIKK